MPVACRVLIILSFILMLLVANLANKKICKKPLKKIEILAHSTHLRVLSESYPINTNMAGFRWFSIIFMSYCALDESIFSIGRVRYVVKCLTCDHIWNATMLFTHRKHNSYLRGFPQYIGEKL